MIPKKIHYCWFGKKPLPNDVKQCIESWKKYASDYEIIEWNESNFDINCHPFLKAAYEAKVWAFVSDYARLKIIYENGGIYFDTDVELLRKPDFLLSHKFYIGIQQMGKFANTGLGFGAESGNIIVKKMMKKYDNAEFSLSQKEKLACPYFNMAVLEEEGYKYQNEIWLKDGTAVYPCKYFDPLAPGNTEDLLCDDTVSIHHYTASWAGNREKMKRKLINFIGQKRINKIKKLIKR